MDGAKAGCGGGACDERERDTADHRRGEREHPDCSWQAPHGHVPRDAAISGVLLIIVTRHADSGVRYNAPDLRGGRAKWTFDQAQFWLHCYWRHHCTRSKFTRLLVRSPYHGIQRLDRRRAILVPSH